MTLAGFLRCNTKDRWYAYLSSSVLAYSVTRLGRALEEMFRDLDYKLGRHCGL